MARKSRRWIVVSALLLSLCGLTALGIGFLQLRGERARLEVENGALNEKVVLLQRKYKEEKARVGGFERTQAGLEGQKRTLQNELARLKEENASLAEQKEEAEKGLGGQVLALRSRVDALSKELSAEKAASDALRSEYAQAKKEFEDKMRRLVAENRNLDEDLKRQEQRLARCTLNNGELCGLVDELLSKYENKGVVTSILQKEPFTQLEKAEVEKLVQEYRDRKADHSIERFQEQPSE